MTKKSNSQKSTKTSTSSKGTANKTAKNSTKRVGRPKKESIATPKESKGKSGGQSKTRGVSKVKKDTKKIPSRRGRKPKAEPDSEVEVKLREIVNKTKAKSGLAVEEKKDSLTFTLNDVRSILEKGKKMPKQKAQKPEVDKKVKSETPAPKKKGRASKVKRYRLHRLTIFLDSELLQFPLNLCVMSQKFPKNGNLFIMT